jgi:two-component system response regulator GlrR
MDAPTVLQLDFDPDSDLGNRLKKILDSSFNVEVCAQEGAIAHGDISYNNIDMERLVSRFDPEIILLILPQLSLRQAASIFQSIKVNAAQAPIIIVAEPNEPEQMLDLLKLGATDFITPPLKATNVLPRLWRIARQARTDESLTRSLKEKISLREFIGETPAFLEEVNKIPLIAKCDANVLIVGETGTGKELCARAIHYLSPRMSQPFTPVNCGAIPLDLVENELFGHERGAFTGASNSQKGLIQEADGSTLFLDEIDSLSQLAQVKLLRFLQEKEYRPLGSTRMRKADVRIVAATNIHPEEALRTGKLRQDLYYRLSIIPLVLIPLRERKEDIPLLTRHFLKKYSKQFDKPSIDISPKAFEQLSLYDWPGNVRELEHAIERAVALSKNDLIAGFDLALPGRQSPPREESFQEAKARIVEEFEKSYIRQMLATHNGNITKAAEAAQKNRRAFFELMRKYRISPASYKSART